MTSSFDIFDTCLVRACGTPDNFFDILSKRVFKEDVSENLRQEFVISRKKAEQIAAGISSKIDLSDIYNHFDFCHPVLLAKEIIKEIELGLEEELILPVINIKRIIDEYRKKNKRIIFISDMYLSASFLSNILKKYGLFKDGDGIYISGEIGFCKYNGELFKYIQKKENISYKEWTHYGDNLVSDIKEPQKLGIKTVLSNFPYSPYTNDYLRDNTIGFNYKNIIISLTRSIYVSEEEHYRKSLILEIIAPIYCSFLYNVFATAHKKGITHLFFCARDTYQLYKMSGIIGALFPEIKSHYIIISRQVLSDSSSQEIVNYFTQEGLASKEYNSAIVDITSSGRTINIINNILVKYGYNSIYCFLFLKWDDSTINTNTNIEDYDCVLRQDYLLKNPQNNYFLNSFSFTSIVESLFSSNTQKRAIKYQNKDNIIHPVFSDSISSGDLEQPNIEQLELIHEHFLNKYAHYWVSLHLFNYSDTIIKEIAVPRLLDFLFIPEKKYLKGLLGCKIKLNNDEVKDIIKKERILKLFISRGKDTAWDRGTILFSLPNYLRKIFINKRIINNQTKDTNK